MSHPALENLLSRFVEAIRAANTPIPTKNALKYEYKACEDLYIAITGDVPNTETLDRIIGG